MVKHIVCFKLKENTQTNCERAKEMLLSMKGRVPQVRQLTVDLDFLHSERSYDVMLTVLVDDRAALEAYQADPYHCGTVKPYMHEVRSASIALDAEI